MAVTPNAIITPQTVRTATAVVDTASTDMDDAPTTSVLLLTAGANGARLTRLNAIARATFNGRIDLWLSKDAGVTKRWINSILHNVTLSTTAALAPGDFGYSEDNALKLEAADRLYVSTAVTLAAGVVVHAGYDEY